MQKLIVVTCKCGQVFAAGWKELLDDQEIKEFYDRRKEGYIVKEVDSENFNLKDKWIKNDHDARTCNKEPENQLTLFDS